MDALNGMTTAYAEAKADPAFQAELDGYLADYVGRPSPLFFAKRLSEKAGGAVIYLKREDLNHTGATRSTTHSARSCWHAGWARRGDRGNRRGTARRRHRDRLPLFGIDCTVYMGEEDIRRQKLNVFNMRTLGAKVVAVTTGSRTLRDATNEALRDWMGSSRTTHYTIGSVVGPHPFPMIVRDFQAVIGRETKAQCLAKIKRLPDCVVACVGGGSNAAGMFYDFIPHPTVEIVGAEAGGAARHQGNTPPASRKGVPEYCTAVLATCFKTRTARRKTFTRFRPDSTIRGSVPNMPTGKTPDVSAMKVSPTPKHSRLTT